MTYINKNKIIQAEIIEPYQNSGLSGDFLETHGWIIVLIMDGAFDGFPVKITIDKDSKEECKNELFRLGLTRIK